MDESEPAEKPPSNCIPRQNFRAFERNDKRKEEGDGDDLSLVRPGINRDEPFWPRVCNLRWFLFRRSCLFFRLSYTSPLHFVIIIKKQSKPREATRAAENGKYPLKVQASARCWPLTNVVESSVKDWQWKNEERSEKKRENGWMRENERM